MGEKGCLQFPHKHYLLPIISRPVSSSAALQPVNSCSSAPPPWEKKSIPFAFPWDSPSSLPQSLGEQTPPFWVHIQTFPSAFTMREPSPSLEHFRIINYPKTIQHRNLLKSQLYSPWSDVTCLCVSEPRYSVLPVLCFFACLSAGCCLPACSLRSSKEANFRVLHHPAMERHGVMSESAACGTTWSCYFIS